jgi:hypothetical protein
MTAYDLGQFVGQWLGAVEQQCPAPRLAPALPEPSARLKTRDWRLPANGSQWRPRPPLGAGSPFREALGWQGSKAAICCKRNVNNHGLRAAR